MRGRYRSIGAFAELISIKEGSVAIKPKSLSMEEAASMPLVGLTAWQTLIERANLAAGRRFSSTRAPVAWERLQSTGKASWRDRGDDNEHGECRLGEGPWCRRRHRLQKDDFEAVLRDYNVVLDTLGEGCLKSPCGC